MSLHPSPGLDGDPCGSSTAAWDGNDAWPVSATSLLGGAGGASAGGGGGSGGAGGGPQCNPPGWDVDAARYVDTQAYVSNWWLVANLPEIALEFVADNDAVPVQLTAGFVVGRIENASGRWRMRDAVVAGRWRLAEFFRMLGTITNAGEPICTDTSVYLLLKSAVCQYPDIASALGGPTTPCDSLSAAIGFDADPAQMGTVYTNFAVQPLCPPATDPQYDGCD
jgi:hypothetical protein